MSVVYHRASLLQHPSVQAWLGTYWTTLLRSAARGTKTGKKGRVMEEPSSPPLSFSSPEQGRGVEEEGKEKEGEQDHETSHVNRNTFCFFFVLWLKHSRAEGEGSCDEQQAHVTAMEHWNAFTTARNRETMGCAAFRRALFAWVDRLAYSVDPHEYVLLLEEAFERTTKEVQGVVRFKKLAEEAVVVVASAPAMEAEREGLAQPQSYLASLHLAQLGEFSRARGADVASHRRAVDLVDQTRAKARAARREQAAQMPFIVSMPRGAEKRETRVERKQRKPLHTHQVRVAFQAAAAPDDAHTRTRGWDGHQGFRRVVARREAPRNTSHIRGKRPPAQSKEREVPPLDQLQITGLWTRSE